MYTAYTVHTSFIHHFSKLLITFVLAYQQQLFILKIWRSSYTRGVTKICQVIMFIAIVNYIQSAYNMT